MKNRGFKDMEVAFGVKHKHDNLSQEEKDQFGDMVDFEEYEKTKLTNLGKPKADANLKNIQKNSSSEADDYYDNAFNKIKNYQKPNQVASPSRIGEDFNPVKVNVNEKDPLEDEMYNGHMGTGMSGLRYDDEGSENHDNFVKRNDKLNGKDETYSKLKKYGDKYKGYKYGDKYIESEDEYQETPRVRTTQKEGGVNQVKENYINEGENSALVFVVLFLSSILSQIPIKQWPQYLAENSRDLFVDFLKFMKKFGYSTDTDYVKNNFDSLLKKGLGKLYKEGGVNQVKENYINEGVKYSDVMSENIFKTKGRILSESQVLKVAKKVPSRVKIDETVFAVTDGENFYRLVWEGDKSGEPVITHQKNPNKMNESIEKMKHLWDFGSNNQTKVSENSEEAFMKMYNKIKGNNLLG